MEAKEILVVDDNRLNQVALLAVLSKLGLSADVAADGLQAIEAVKKKTYDLVLMDIMMPAMDGIEATRVIRGLEQRMPIIAVTALDIRLKGRECLEAGMNDFIEKPIDIDKLREKLNWWCGTGLAQ